MGDMTWLLIEEAEAAYVLTGETLGHLIETGELNYKMRTIGGRDYFLVMEHQVARVFHPRIPKSKHKETFKRIAEALGTGLAGALIYDLIKASVAQDPLPVVSSNTRDAKGWIRRNIVNYVIDSDGLALKYAMSSSFGGHHTPQTLADEFDLPPGTLASLNIVMRPSVAVGFLNACGFDKLDETTLEKAILAKEGDSRCRFRDRTFVCGCATQWLSLVPGTPRRFKNFVSQAVTMGQIAD